MLWQAIGGAFLAVFALIALIGLFVPERKARKENDPGD